MDRRPIVIVMRYSVLKAANAAKTGWELIKTNDYETYRAALLAPERLRERLSALTNIVLPSLLAQTTALSADRHCLLLLTSTELPAAERLALEQAIAPYPWILLRPLPPQQEIGFADGVKAALDRMGFRSGPFATVRLDDDDALARQYFERLERLITDGNVGKVVTFPVGYVGKFDHSRARFTEFYKSHQRFNAQGLAAIHRSKDGAILPADRQTVYQFGRHGDIGSNGQPYVEDASFRSYLRSVYPTQDTASRSREFGESQRVARKVVAQHVGLASGEEAADGPSFLTTIARRLGLSAGRS